MDGDELELLLSLDGAAYEMAPDVIIEFTIKRTAVTLQRPHGVSHALVLRPRSGGTPWVSSTTRTRSRRAAGDAGALSTTTRTGPSMTRDALTGSRRQSSCSTIFGGR